MTVATVHHRPLRVVVLGTGFVGGPLCARLLDQGHHVFGLSRRGAAPQDVIDHPGFDRFTSRAFDVTAGPEAAVEAFIPADAWVLCHASGGTQDRRQVFLEGARHIVAAARAHRPGRVVQASSTSALPDMDGPVHEDTPGRPTSERGAIQRDAEDLYRAGMTELGLPLTTLRLAGLYGPGRALGRLYLRRVSAAVDAGEAPTMPGDGHQATNLIHRDDAVAALVVATTRPQALDGIVHVCDDDHRSRREMVDALAQARGLPAPAWEKAAPAGPPRGKRVANDRLKRELSMVLRHPHHDPRAANSSA